MCRKYYNKITSTHINKIWRELIILTMEVRSGKNNNPVFLFFTRKRVTLNTTGSDEGVSRKRKRREEWEKNPDWLLTYLFDDTLQFLSREPSISSLALKRKKFLHFLTLFPNYCGLSPFTSVLIITICVTKTLTIVYTVWWQSSRHTILPATGFICLFLSLRHLFLFFVLLIDWSCVLLSIPHSLDSNKSSTDIPFALDLRSTSLCRKRIQ